MAHLEAIREGKGLLDWVRVACELYPDQIAIQSGSRRISYRVLDEDVNQLANCLMANGVGPGSVAAVLNDDRAHLPIRMLGILRAGCVFVPLDPDAPRRRLERVFSELQPGMVVAAGKTLIGLQEVHPSLDRPCRVIGFGELGGGKDLPDWLRLVGRPPASCPSGTPQLDVDPDVLSYIYYTSGSTGQPKGIAGRLRGVSHRIRWELETFQIGRGWRVSQLISPTFDAYLRDVFVPLCSGGTVCLPPDAPSRLDPLALLEWLEAERINLVHCVPSLFSTIPNVPARIRRLPDLRLVLLSGEVLHVASVRRWRRRFGETARLVNLYGATEATMVQFFHVVEGADLDRGFIPIGRPMEGDAALLLDEKGSPCRQGTVGEIGIRSPFLSLGYYRDEEAMRASFDRLDPDRTGGPNFYRTGDLAVELDDGSYRLLGRRDSQVKIRGVRVEVGEIEASLLEYPQVTGCAVTARTGSPGNVALVAYIEATSRDRPSIPELRLHLRERLPPEMLPARFIFLDELPRSANGKVDRTALPDPGGVRAGGRASARATAQHSRGETGATLGGSPGAGYGRDPRRLPEPGRALTHRRAIDLTGVQRVRHRNIGPRGVR